MRRWSRMFLSLLIVFSLLCASSCAGVPKDPDPLPDPVPADPEDPPKPTKASFEDLVKSDSFVPDLYTDFPPKNENGTDGMLFLRTDTRELFVKEEGAWRSLGKLAQHGYHQVSFACADADLSSPVWIVKDGKTVKVPEMPEISGKDFEGWFSSGYDGRFDENTPVKDDLTVTGYYIDRMEKTAPLLINQDLDTRDLRTEGTNGMLVVCFTFTDGTEVDHAYFEDLFQGQYELDECLRSVNSYFHYTSYGKVDFDFRFHYVDTGISSAEAYQIVQEQYRDYVFAYVDEIRKENPEEMKELDKDKDGYLDSLVIITAEDSLKTVNDGNVYFLFGGSSGKSTRDPNRKLPDLGSYSYLSYDELNLPLEEEHGGTRILIHEIGHQFGLEDYYDRTPAPDTEYEISTLGEFDMQDVDRADWNVYSRYACGWIDPYVIEGKIDKITLKLRCSAEAPDTVLLTSSAGFNGTPFDEYVLIDVLAPRGASGFDWKYVTDEHFMTPGDPRVNGGVRVYHVDSRKVKVYYINVGDEGHAAYLPLSSYEEIKSLIKEIEQKQPYQIWNRFWNSNGLTPVIEGDSMLYHLVDVLPRDGSDKFRINHYAMWCIYMLYSVSDLFGPGDVFSMDTCAGSFPNAPYLNTGGTLDYTVTVEHYDTVNHEAIITISGKS
ncbi:MAG: hypothetical protein IIY44_01310 [Erysipelotrichales bacterium]|nr:hypothetical protein [Erysipelotrichales bacterium]